jgi:hypothetical protein
LTDQQEDAVQSPMIILDFITPRVLVVGVDPEADAKLAEIAAVQRHQHTAGGITLAEAG